MATLGTNNPRGNMATTFEPRRQVVRQSTAFPATADAGDVLRLTPNITRGKCFTEIVVRTPKLGTGTTVGNIVIVNAKNETATQYRVFTLDSVANTLNTVTVVGKDELAKGANGSRNTTIADNATEHSLWFQTPVPAGQEWFVGLHFVTAVVGGTGTVEAAVDIDESIGV